MTALLGLGVLSFVMLVQMACVDSASPVRPAPGPGERSPLPVLRVAADDPVGAAFLECDGASFVSGDSLFCFDETPRTWEGAARHCEDIGGQLAHLESPEEALALRQAFGAPFSLPQNLLIGLVEPFREGEWGWMSGSRATYESWLPGEPNDSGGEDCAELNVATGKWNDISCQTGLPFLCEGAPVPVGGKSGLSCADTLVWAGQTPYCVHADQWLTAPQAEQVCRKAGGHLAELSTAEKDEAFLAAIRPPVGGGAHVWLGVTDARREGQFRTAAGRALPFTAWRSGEPNNVGEEDCAVWGPVDGLWNDVPCGGQAPSLCRGTASPTRDRGSEGGW